MANETNQIILTLLALSVLVLFFTLPTASTLSIFNFDAPVVTIGDATLTRGDLYYILDIASITSWLVAFIILLTRKLRKKDTSRIFV